MHEMKLGNLLMTWEHVIPEHVQLGLIYKAFCSQMTCTSCNNLYCALPETNICIDHA